MAASVASSPAQRGLGPNPLPGPLARLVSLPPDQLARCDLATMNLLCAVGLPGTEALDVKECLATLAQWTDRIALLTENHRPLFQQRRGEFENSEPLWRVCCIARVLEHECGIHYVQAEMDKDSPADWRQSDRHLIHGLLGPQRHGACASLPVLLAAIGRRLDYPIKLVHSPGHVFARWDGLDHPEPAWREKRNFEFSGGLDSHTDEHYHHSPVKWSPELHATERARSVPLYLRSLTPAEELASFLVQRGHALEAYERFPEAWAAYAAASTLAPHVDGYQYCAKQCHERHLDLVLKPWGLSGSQFCRRIEKRLRGSRITLFPWETADGKRIPRINPYCDPRTAAPLIAAERAVAARLSGAGQLPALAAVKALATYTAVPSPAGLSPGAPSAPTTVLPSVITGMVGPTMPVPQFWPK